MVIDLQEMAQKLKDIGYEVNLWMHDGKEDESEFNMTNPLNGDHVCISTFKYRINWVGYAKAVPQSKIYPWLELSRLDYDCPDQVYNAVFEIYKNPEHHGAFVRR